MQIVGEEKVLNPGYKGNINGQELEIKHFRVRLLTRKERDMIAQEKDLDKQNRAFTLLSIVNLGSVTDDATKELIYDELTYPDEMRIDKAMAELSERFQDDTFRQDANGKPVKETPVKA
jgi:hypothetical protein